MIVLTFGYFIMALIFLVVRICYHILPKNHSQTNFVQAIREDLISFYAYVKQTVVSNPKKAKIVAVIMEK